MENILQSNLEVVLVNSDWKGVRNLSAASYGHLCSLQNIPEWRECIAKKKTNDTRRAFLGILWSYQNLQIMYFRLRCFLCNVYS